jgi:hypothetical protein
MMAGTVAHKPASIGSPLYKRSAPGGEVGQLTRKNAVVGSIASNTMEITVSANICLFSQIVNTPPGMVKANYIATE